MPAEDMQSKDQCDDIYGVRQWGADYFDVSTDGKVTIKWNAEQSLGETAILDIINDVKDRGIQLPVLMRFENLLEEQITRLNQAFAKAITKTGYQAPYRGVFPIKVNQQCHVIEEIAEVGAKFGNGLEAGSKPELIIALAHLMNKDACVICNGYKDREFIELGLYAVRMGYKCIFVIETLTEVPIIIEQSKKMGVKPLIGVRVKLSSIVGGHWNATSGDRSIFGLTIAQLVELLDTLKEENLLDSLQLLHYHLGSQIPNIRDIRSGVLEACHVYMDLKREGADMQYLDLGGGLAVDYDGSKSNSIHSRNYSLDEYCEDIIDVVMSTLDPHDIKHPTIITESGRALTAYSSVLLFNILDVTKFEPGPLPETLDKSENINLRNLQFTLDNLSENRLQEFYNDAVFYRDEIRELFKRGQVSLRSRSVAENIFLKIVRAALTIAESKPSLLPEIDKIKEQMSDIYYGNFSIFQSLPDIWAIDQIFPVVPIHRHNETPTRNAIIADITCDCDGKIDRFSNMQSITKSIRLHELKPKEDYILGAFLVGAYQETLGDLHNLFGDPHAISVRFDSDGHYEFSDEIEGDSISDVLSYVEYVPSQLKERFRKICESAVKSKTISAAERQQIMKAFSESMQGYTYYEN